VEQKDNGRSVLGRGFAVLDCFTSESNRLRLCDIAERTGLPKPTVHRIVTQLLAWRGLEREGAYLRMGLRVFELGALARQRVELREVALPFMEDLYEATHETVHLGVLDGLEVVYVEKIAGHHGVTSPSRVGGRMPLYCTGLGKVLLSFESDEFVDKVIGAGLCARTCKTITSTARLRQELVDIRRAGVAFDYEESLTGMGCAAAPIVVEQGRASAALSVTMALTRADPQRLAAAVRTAAGSISRSLGGPPRHR
jgi:DNA-binding IclR family transcriptional regulator